jgi:hypothetical protein
MNRVVDVIFWILIGPASRQYRFFAFVRAICEAHANASMIPVVHTA